MRQSWSAQIGSVDFSMQPKVVGQTIALVSSTGRVAALDARSGQQLWAVEVGSPVSAGVGFDGRFAALVTRTNELVVIEDSKISWRSRVGAQVLTAPLVAGDRVFVLGADRSLAAYDAKTGRKLWLTQRPGEPLVLRQAGVLTAVGNTLVVGSAGHLLGVDPLNGNVIWDAALATPRGTNDIERLVDVVSGFVRSADIVCVRAFQSVVSCVDTKRGTVVWKKPSVGSVGLAGDGESVFGVDETGQLVAMRQSDGEQRWLVDRLRYRQLSAPLALGRSVVVGDIEKAIDILANAYAVEQNNQKLNKLLGLLSFKGKDYDTAIKVLSQYLSQDPDTDEIWYYLSIAQKKMGNYLSSLEAAKKVYELQPTNINNLVNLSDLHRLNGNYMEAKLFSEKVISLDSENKNAKKLLNVLNSMQN